MPDKATVSEIPPLSPACYSAEPRFFIAPWHFSALVCVVLMLSGLAGYGMLDPDEGRYAEVPREMLESGDFITPRLNYVPYLEKPPLLYWATAGAFKVFGMAPWVLRLVPAICAIAGMLVAWWLTLVCFGRHSARWAPSIIASTIVYFVLARTPIIDMMFSVFLAAALTAWLAGDHRSRGRRYWLWLASGLLLGGALMSKGPAAVVLFAAIVFVYLLWVRRPLEIFAGVGLPVAVATATFMPWVLAIQRATPEFYHYFFIVQHVERFLGKGIPEHVQPFYYFLVVLPLGFMFWSFYWPGIIRSALRHKWVDVPPSLRNDTAFLIIWFVIVMAFFSASTCKLAQYILPVWWPVAAVMAAWLRREFCISNPRRRLYVPTLLTALFVMLMVGGMIIWAGRQNQVPMLVLQRPLLIFAGAGILSVSLLLFTSWLSNRHWSLAQLTLGAILPLAGMLPGVYQICAFKDMNGLIPPQLMNLPKETPWVLAQWNSYNQSFNYHTRKRIILINNFNELGRVGLMQPDADKWFLKGEEKISELSARGPLALVVNVDDKDRIAKKYKLHIFASNHNRATLFNDAGWQLVRSSAPKKAPESAAVATPVRLATTQFAGRPAHASQ